MEDLAAVVPRDVRDLRTLCRLLAIQWPEP